MLQCKNTSNCCWNHSSFVDKMQTRDVLHDWQYEDNVKLIILNTLHSLATHAPYYFGYRPFSIHQRKGIVHVALPLPLRIKIWKGKWSSLDVGGGGNNKVLLDKIKTIIRRISWLWPRQAIIGSMKTHLN